MKARPRRLRDVHSFIVEQSRGKSVLNVGAAGGVETYLPSNAGLWLNHRLSLVARELLAVDVDRDSIAYAARHGVSILHADCESMDLGRRFDVIVLSDVIEHLNAPGIALRTLVNHLTDAGRLYVTTPNPTHYGLILRAVLSKQLSIYYDHVNAFAPENIQAMCDRYQCALTELYFFGGIDRRTFSNRLKSYVGYAIGAVSPRLHAAFLAVIERGKEQ